MYILKNLDFNNNFKFNYTNLTKKTNIFERRLTNLCVVISR